MAKLPTLKRLQYSDIPDAEPWSEKLILFINNFFQNVYELVNGQLRFEDNIRAKLLLLERAAPFTSLIIPVPFSPVTGVFLASVRGIGITDPVVLRWHQDQGNIVIDALSGLTSGTTYKVTLLII